jgi:hypothetical protein
MLAQISLIVNDATANSVNGTVWWDNVQIWDQTATNQTSMPYCELRGRGPFQAMVSGILGDVAMPCIVASGTYRASFVYGGSSPATANRLNYLIGRRSNAGATAQLVQQNWNGLDALTYSTSAYGYWYQTTAGISDYQLWSTSNLQDILGTYHVISRIAYTGGSPTTTTAYHTVQQYSGSWAAATQQAITYPTVTPFTGSAWTTVDSGQVTAQAYASGALADLTTTSYVLHEVTNPAYPSTTNYVALLPIDTEVIVAQFGGSTGYQSIFGINIPWIYGYFDGINGSSVWSVGGSSIPAITSTASNALATNSGDPRPMVDPTIKIGSTSVNQWLIHVTDDSNAILQTAIDIYYYPGYLFPR